MIDLLIICILCFTILMFYYFKYIYHMHVYEEHSVVNIIENGSKYPIYRKYIRQCKVCGKLKYEKI